MHLCRVSLAFRLERMAHILERIDALGGLFNLATHDLGNELGRELREGTARGFALNDLDHFLPNRADLRRGRVRGLFDLIWPSLGKSNGE